MNERISPEDLVQRYVHEIGSRLPAKERSDVMQELHSLLSDTLEQRSRKPDSSYDTPLVNQVLKEFGSPEEVASRYRGRPSYLIGPDLYPAFIRTLKLIFLIAGIVTLVLVTLSTLSLTRPGASVTDVSALVRWFDVFWNFAWTAFGIAVVVFAVLEKIGVPDFKQKTEWDPLELPPVDDPHRVPLTYTSFRIYGIVVLFLLFNLFVDRLGILLIDSARGVRLITLAELGVSFPLLLLNTWWLVALARNLFLLYRGRENHLTRWVEVALGLFGAGILYLILQGVSLAVDQGSFVEAIGAATLGNITGRVTLIALSLALFFTLFASVQRVYRLLREEFRSGSTSS